VFILQYYFASELFSAVCEAFSNVYPDKEVPNKTIHFVTLCMKGFMCSS
jgi:hypothetical protein